MQGETGEADQSRFTKQKTKKIDYKSLAHQNLEIMAEMEPKLPQAIFS